MGQFGGKTREARVMGTLGEGSCAWNWEERGNGERLKGGLWMW